jgi:nucleoside-diphosphate-sugar epimerase
MANILVTGGAGYIGSILLPELLNAGHSVTVLDNFYYQQSSLNHVCYHKNFNIVRGDARVKDNVLPLLKTADVIFPLAGLVGAPLCDADPVTATTTNKDAIFMMLDHVSNDQLIIMPTTNSAYGSGDENHFCTEESKLNPISRYAIDKVAVEKRLMDHSSAISYRLATVFGMSPRMRIDLLVNDFTYRAVNDGFIVLFESHYKRNYIHIRDVANACMFAIENNDRMKGNIYNVGLSDANISKFELCEKISKHIPKFTYIDSSIGNDPDQRNYIVSNEKIENAGFKTQFSLDDGISELIKGYRILKNQKYGNNI